MKIKLNGKIKNVQYGITLAIILKDLNFYKKHIAIAVNKNVIPKQKWENYVLHELDNIDIVQAIGGG